MEPFDAAIAFRVVICLSQIWPPHMPQSAARSLPAKSWSLIDKLFWPPLHSLFPRNVVSLTARLPALLFAPGVGPQDGRLKVVSGIYGLCSAGISVGGRKW